MWHLICFFFLTVSRIFADLVDQTYVITPAEIISRKKNMGFVRKIL